MTTRPTSTPFAALRSARDGGIVDVALCIGVDSEEAPDGLADLADAVVRGPEGFLQVLEALGASSAGPAQATDGGAR